MLISILSLSLTAFSQTDTNKQPQKCFPVPVVKQITKDLLSGDSAKEQLKLVGLQLIETEKKVEMKDSVISLLRIKETNYQTVIGTQNEKYSVLENHTKKVELSLKKEKLKSKFTVLLSVAVITSFILITR